MTDKEKEIVERLAHPLYDVEFLEKWTKRNDSVFSNAPAAMQACSAKGFYAAIKLMADRIPTEARDDEGGAD